MRYVRTAEIQALTVALLHNVIVILLLYSRPVLFIRVHTATHTGCLYGSLTQTLVLTSP